MIEGVVYELLEPKREAKHTPPLISIAMFDMVFVGVVRRLWDVLIQVEAVTSIFCSLLKFCSRCKQALFNLY